MPRVTRFKKRENCSKRAIIETKCDPIQVTFLTDTNTVFPAWVAVLRYRYVTHLPQAGLTTTWVDYERSDDLNTKIVIVNNVKYNDEEITVRPLPKHVVQTTIRVHRNDKQLLVMHLYYTNGNVLVQGATCIKWVKEDFERLQSVVLILSSRPSKTAIMEAWQEEQATLTSPPDTESCDVDTPATDLALPLTDSDPSEVTTSGHSTTPLAIECDGISDTTLQTTENCSAAVQLLTHDDASKLSCSELDTATVDAEGVQVVEDCEQEDPKNIDSASTTMAENEHDTANCPPALEDFTQMQTESPSSPSSPSSLIITSMVSSTQDESSQSPLPIPSSITNPTPEKGTTIETSDSEAAANNGSNPPGSDDTSTNTESVVMPLPSPETMHAMLLQVMQDFESYKMHAQKELADQKALLQTQTQDLENYKAHVQQELADQKTQLQNAQRVQDKTLSRAMEELDDKCALKDSEIQRLQKTCHSLQQTVTQLKKDKSASASPTNIEVTMNNGKYGQRHGLAGVTSTQLPQSKTAETHTNTVSKDVPSPNTPTSPPTHVNPTAETDQTSGDGDQLSDDELRNKPRVSGPLRLSSSVTQLIIGDSNLKNIKTKRLSPRGEVQVKTFRGAVVSDISEVLSAQPQVQSMEKLVLHVGTNDISKAGNRADGATQFREQYSRLLDTVRNKMPSAQIAVSALPPMKPWTKLRTVRKYNEELKQLCVTKNVTFLPHDALWTVDDNGRIDPTVLSDRVHMSPSGLSLFLRDTKPFVTGRQSSPGQPHKARNNTVKEQNNYVNTQNSNVKGQFNSGTQRPLNSSKVTVQSSDRNDSTVGQPPMPPPHYSNSAGGERQVEGVEGSDYNGDRANPQYMNGQPLPPPHPFFSYLMGSRMPPFPPYPMYPWYFGQPPNPPSMW